MMFIPDQLYNLFRKHFGTWEIKDPREIAAKAPYTFYLPPKEHLASLVIDDLVKIEFCGKPFGLNYDAERMWVIFAFSASTGAAPRRRSIVRAISSELSLEFAKTSTPSLFSLFTPR